MSSKIEGKDVTQDELELMCQDFEIELKNVDSTILGELKSYISKETISRGKDEKDDPVLDVKLSKFVSIFGKSEKTNLIKFAELSGADHEKLANSGNRQTGTALLEAISKCTGIIMKDLRDMKNRDIKKLEVALSFLS